VVIGVGVILLVAIAVGFFVVPRTPGGDGREEAESVGSPYAEEE
jgi:hypothetical protein